MKKTVTLICVVVGLSVATAANAQFGGISSPLGDKKAAPAAGKSDPAAVEKDLRSIIGTTNTALAKLAEALGSKSDADKAQKNAECIANSSCGVSDGINVTNGISESIKSQIDAFKAKGQKLNADSGKAASQAILPAIKAIPLWMSVINNGKAVASDSSAMMKAAALVKALPNVPGAMKGSTDVLSTSIDYLSFSGVDTKEDAEALKASMKM